MHMAIAGIGGTVDSKMVNDHDDVADKIIRM